MVAVGWHVEEVLYSVVHGEPIVLDDPESNVSEGLSGWHSSDCREGSSLSKICRSPLHDQVLGVDVHQGGEQSAADHGVVGHVPEQRSILVLREVLTRLSWCIHIVHDI